MKPPNEERLPKARLASAASWPSRPSWVYCLVDPTRANHMLVIWDQSIPIIHLWHWKKIETLGSPMKSHQAPNYMYYTSHTEKDPSNPPLHWSEKSHHPSLRISFFVAPAGECGAHKRCVFPWRVHWAEPDFRAGGPKNPVRLAGENPHFIVEMRFRRVGLSEYIWISDEKSHAYSSCSPCHVNGHNFRVNRCTLKSRCPASFFSMSWRSRS